MAITLDIRISPGIVQGTWIIRRLYSMPANMKFSVMLFLSAVLWECLVGQTFCV